MNSRDKKFDHVEIIDLAVNGKGIAKIGGMTFFISDVIPGDIVNIEIVKRKRKYTEARVTEFISTSPDHSDPVCEHFSICGGCRLQNIKYEAQLRLKQKIVSDAFLHIGHISGFQENTIISSASVLEYRNKLEYSFSDNKWLTAEQIKSCLVIENKNAAGFHIPGLFDKILDINTCHLQSEPSNAIRNTIRKYIEDNHYSFYNIRNNQGFIRSLIIRNSTMGELMVILVFGENDDEKIAKTMSFISLQFPEINSLYYIINLKKNDSLYDQVPILFKGEEFIHEKFGNLVFLIGPKSFFQTNPVQAENLFKKVVEIGNFDKNKIVYDLYSGVGSISLFLAGFSGKIVAIESVPESVEESVKNAGYNKTANINFFCGEVEKSLNKEFIDQNGKPDIIILDPPRAGLHPGIIPVLLESNCPEIIYVSCNPATQARDISMLENRYTTELIQPVDMFPQTLHVENIAFLKLKR